MGREAGRGFRMGNTCTLMADSCCCMAKPIQYCKVKNNNNSKIKFKKQKKKEKRGDSKTRKAKRSRLSIVQK